MTRGRPAEVMSPEERLAEVGLILSTAYLRRRDSLSKRLASLDPDEALCVRPVDGDLSAAE